MQINGYSFGRIVVDGKAYTKDIKIIGGRLVPNWWRRQGHLLQMEDIEDVIAARPHTLIVGTGSSGVMRIGPGVAEQLGAKGIRLEALPTAMAVERFNELAGMEGVERVAGAFHLTC